MLTTSKLPRPSTPFVGRTEEVAEIIRLLDDPDCRLLTLVGPGGIGKTRLALEVAQIFTSQPLRLRDKGRGEKIQGEKAVRRVARFADGAYFVPLQALTSPDSLVSTIADAVGYQFYPGGDPKQQLLQYFRDKTLLLLLDNFEHLIEGAELLSEILKAAPDVQMLVTSRERLNLIEEWVFDVRELKYPASEAETDIEGYDAVQLFVQQARRAHVGFTLTSLQKPAVIRICRLVGGMPLGIELAAARTRALPCAGIAEEIARSLDILETPARNIEPRHRNIRAAFEPMWDRLTDEQRSVFKKLSVFRGGFTREAAERIAGASVQTLSALVDRSLARLDENGRYDLHELLRQYGDDKLHEQSEDYAAARDAHLTFYAAFAAVQGETMRGAGMNEAIDAAHIEYNNLLTAWNWACEHPQYYEILWDFTFCLSWFLYQAFRHHEVSNVFEPALTRLKQAEKASPLTGVLLAFQAGILFLAAYHEEAALPLAQAIPSLDQYDDEILRREAGVGLNLASFACGGLGRLADHQRLGQRAIALCQIRGWRFEQAYAMQLYAYSFLAHYLTLDYEYESDLQTTRLLTEESLRIAEETGNPMLRGWGRTILGVLAVREDNLAEAKALLLKSLEMVHDVPARGATYLWLIEAALRKGDFHEARQWCQQAFQLISQVGMHFNSARALLLAATEVLAGLAESERAAELVGWCKIHWGEPYFAALARGQTTTYTRKLESQLGTEIYIAAVRRGQSVDPDELVQLVLSEISKLEQLTVSPITPPGSAAHSDALTEREVEVLALVAEGLTNQDIANRLYVGVSTVKKHINHIYDKLNVKNRTQAVARAREAKILS